MKTATTKGTMAIPSIVDESSCNAEWQKSYIVGVNDWIWELMTLLTITLAK